MNAPVPIWLKIICFLLSVGAGFHVLYTFLGAGCLWILLRIDSQIGGSHMGLLAILVAWIGGLVGAAVGPMVVQSLLYGKTTRAYWIAIVILGGILLLPFPGPFPFISV